MATAYCTSSGVATPRSIAVATCASGSTRPSTSPIRQRRCPTASRSISATARASSRPRSATCSRRPTPTGDSAEIAVRCTYGDEALEARLTLAISDDPAPPRADDTWPLQARGPDGKPSEAGVAWVFRAPGRREIVNPVILVEGFPGGHPCDYLYELLNASGMVDALHGGRVRRDHRRARQRPDADPAQRAGARRVHPRGAQAHAAAAGRRRREHGRAGQPLRAGVDGEARRGPRDAHLPEHRRPARRDVHQPGRAVVRPRARALRPRPAGLLAAAGRRLQRAADDPVVERRQGRARARCATSCWRTSRRWAGTPASRASWPSPAAAATAWAAPPRPAPRR